MGYSDFDFFRPIVFHLYLTGSDCRDAFLCLQTLYGPLIPELPTIKKWYTLIDHDEFMFARKPIGGRKMISNLTEKLHETLQIHPKASTKYLSTILGVHRTTIKTRLSVDMGMRQYKLQWVPHSLSESQKQKRREGASIIKAALHRHCETGYFNLITGDESWFYFDNEADAMWLPRGSEIPKRANKTIASPKIFLTVFFSGKSILHWSYLPPGETMTSSTFITSILEPLLKIIKPETDETIEVGFVFTFFLFILFS
jgi:hypothetical protein